MKKKIILSLTLLVFIAIGYVTYLYNKPHRNIAKEKAVYELKADEIYEEFEKDEHEAYQKYADKVITFTGLLSNISQNTNGQYNIVIKGKSGTINCEISSDNTQNVNKLKENTKIKIKGLCIGFDDLLGELQFKKCSIIF